MGGALRQAQVPAALTRPAARLAAGGARLVGLPVPFRLARLTWRTDNRALDTSRARHLLGFVPSSLERAIEETADWCRREGQL
jgi:nucleoside-diphosphate-sugar epimerase